MIVAVLRGGIGNQLFIYAAACAYAKRLGQPLMFDKTSGYLKDKYKRKCEIDILFPDMVPIPKWQAVLLKFLHKFKYSLFLNFFFGKDQLIEVNNENFFLAHSYSNSIHYLYDYFQSEVYCADYNIYIKKIFNSFVLPHKYDEILKVLQRDDTILVHGRLKRAYDANGSLVVAVSDSKQLNQDYFIKALKSKKNVKNIVIFSDAPEDFENLFRSMGIALYVVHEVSGGNALEELILMTRGVKYIISNSTFSWWGAFLSSAKEKTVVAPAIRYWESDLPSSWIVLED